MTLSINIRNILAVILSANKLFNVICINLTSKKKYI